MPDDDDGSQRRRSDQGDWKPRPDPTVLTTEALVREVHTLREFIEAKIEAVVDLSAERFKLLEQALVLRETITEEKFNTVDSQLDLIERQRVEQKADTKAAVDAALTAQKEAVREQTLASEKAIQKSEASTTKQLEQITVTFTTAFAGMTAAIDDLKVRVGKMEAIKQGGSEAKFGMYAAASFVLTILLIIGGVIALRS